MNKISWATIVLMLFLVFGCASVQVSQDYVNIHAFEGLQTFDWHPQPIQYGEDVRESNPLLHSRFQEVISSVFQEKGYTKSTKADFSITYNYSIVTKIGTYPYTTFFSYGFGHNRHHRYHHYGRYEIDMGYEINQYDVGILVIDVYDNVTNSVIWRGKGTKTITNHSTPQQTTDMVYRMVRRILHQFPPG